jgi:DNA polymerase-3 subunit delta
MVDETPEAPPHLVALVGDDRFLKRLVLDRLMGGGDHWSRYEGDKLAWSDLADELATRSLFRAGPRSVLVENADPFVSRARAELERYASQPTAVSCLVLDLDALPANTNLYKRIADQGWIIACRAPELARDKGKATDTARMRKWLASWARSRHNVTLAGEALDLLVDLTGWDFGLLDQQLAKLALYVEPQESIRAELVQQVIGGWRSETSWEMMEKVADGDAAAALRQLDQLLQSGEAPVALFGSIAWSLRRYATATRIYEYQERSGARPQMSSVLQEAGFRGWPAALDRATRQLKQMTRQRSGQLHQWLLEADLALKGSHSPPNRARWVLESLFLRLSQQARPQK